MEFTVGMLLIWIVVGASVLVGYTFVGYPLVLAAWSCKRLTSDPYALLELVCNFADQTVGAVSGELIRSLPLVLGQRQSNYILASKSGFVRVKAD